LFYFISKVVNLVLAPENWIYILLIIAFVTKKIELRKRLLVISTIIFLLFSNEAIFNKFTNWWQADPVELQDSARYSAGILLGGITMTDKNDQNYLSESSDRFVQTLLLYKRGVINKIITTGTNQINKRSEAEYLRDLFMKAGVPPTDVIPEPYAKNTAENATFSKRIIDSIHAAPPYIVITSAFHVRRSAWLFRKAKMQVIMYPSAYIAVEKRLDFDDYILPKAEVMHKWRFVLKEIFGLWAYSLPGKT
jgi:uncharacterized SAM-binding protein YcdF (DUF218 family)